VTSTVYRDPHGTGTVKFGTAVYRGYREYRPSLVLTVNLSIVSCVFALRASLQCGIICLKRLNYDWRLLQHRRDDSNSTVKGYIYVELALWCVVVVMRFISSHLSLLFNDTS